MLVSHQRSTVRLEKRTMTEIRFLLPKINVGVLYYCLTINSSSEDFHLKFHNRYFKQKR